MAVEYLSRDPGMRSIIKQLESSTDLFTVQINHNHDDRFNRSTNTIFWDPDSALALYDKDSLTCDINDFQSPALGLGHEMAHAARSPLLMLLTEKLQIKPLFDYEERRVVNGPEAAAAKTLGEGVRTSIYGGMPYHVQSPIGR
jgi:hypothetical protein